MTNTIKRGEIYYADLSPAVGSEQDGVRPVLILQNDTGNKFSSTTIIPPSLLCRRKERSLPMSLLTVIFWKANRLSCSSSFAPLTKSVCPTVSDSFPKKICIR